MKTVLNMIGGGFQHDVCSSANNTNKLVEWDRNEHRGNISVHIDYAIFDVIPDKTKLNVAWFAESSAIIPGLVASLKSKEHLEWLTENYDLILTHDKRNLGLHEKIKHTIPNSCPWVTDRRIHPKTKLVSMIASNKTMCSGHLYRQEIIQKYRGQIDHWGTGFITLNRKESALNDYMFSIAMENDNYPGIFCEKITDCFATGTIPIFWGDPTIGEFFNEDGIIRLTNDFKISDLTKDLYYSKMEVIKENYEKSLVLPTAEDYFYQKYLK